MKDILIVEDNDIDQHIMVDVLSEEFNIRTANNGVECLSQINERCPDLLVLDLVMPEMDGYEVIRQIKNNPACVHLPIIVSSAKAREEEKQIVYDLGVENYLTKPYDPDDLTIKIKSILNSV